MAVLPLFLTSCYDDNSSSTTRAGIIAEQMVKSQALSPSDLEFNLVGVDQTGKDEYHVVANTKMLNALGMSVPRRVSVRLRYNGTGDWTDVYNWTKIRINVINEATGQNEDW